MTCSDSDSSSSYEVFEDYYYDSDMTLSSTNSTPSKKGAMSIIDTKAVLDTLRPLLHQDTCGKVFAGAAIQDFVKHVWGVDETTVDSIVNGEWSLEPVKELEAYTTARKEADLYNPFSVFGANLVQKVWDTFHTGEEPAASPDFKFWTKSARFPLINQYCQRKPDMLTLRDSIVKPVWHKVLHILEFKRRFRKTNEDESSSATSRLPSIAEDGGQESSTFPGDLQDALSSRVGEERNQCRSRGSRSTTRALGPSEDGTGSKRKRCAEEDTSTATKRMRSSGESVAPSSLRVNGLQLATYALEAMAASPRFYATGLLVDQFNVTLMYFDRSCVIVSPTFDFKEHPEMLALVLYSLSRCNDKQAGLNPYLTSPPSATTTTTSSTPGKETHSREDRRTALQGSTIAFPGLPVLNIMGLIYGYRGLIGRGTMIYRVSRESGGNYGSEVIKLSWPLSIRPPEAGMINRLQEKLPGWRKHLPQVKHFVTLTAKELGLPRVALLEMMKVQGFEDRDLHVMLMEEYSKLWEVDSVEEFQEVFVDCVECHYWAYTKGKILHRDLSENNLMFRRRDDGGVDGILNDWDMASDVNDEGEPERTAATHRTGTLPFMAHELCQATPPAHLYRHDLESFFYILLWVALHYDFGEKKRAPRPSPHVSNWNHSLDVAHTEKIALFFSESKARQIFDAIRPEFQRMKEQWLEPLLDLFENAFSSRPKLRKPDPAYDFKTLNHQLTFENFMITIGRKPRGEFPSSSPGVTMSD